MDCVALPAGVRCRCGSACSAKQDGHTLQPVRKRFGVWPPPELLFVHIGRVASGGTLRRGRVAVPLDAFPVDALFAQQPRRPGDEWKPERVWYRALSAAYHEPVHIPGEAPSPNGGHYWAIVRGVERDAGGALVSAYRRMNDSVSVGGAQMDAAHGGPLRATRWGTFESERRVAMVVLQRVVAGAPGPSPSERANRLGASMPFDDGKDCPRCTLFNPPRAATCTACYAELPRGR